MKGYISLIKIKLLSFRTLAILIAIYFVSFTGALFCFIKMIDHQIVINNHMDATNQFGAIITQLPAKISTAVKGETAAFQQITDLVKQAERILKEDMPKKENSHIVPSMRSVKKIWEYWSAAVSDIITAKKTLIDSKRNEAAILKAADTLIKVNQKAAEFLSKNVNFQRQSMIASQNVHLIKRMVDSFYQRSIESGEAILLAEQLIGDVEAYENGYQKVTKAVEVATANDSMGTSVISSITQSIGLFDTLANTLASYFADIQVITDANEAKNTIHTQYPELVNAVEMFGREAKANSEKKIHLYKISGFVLCALQAAFLLIIGTFIWFRKKYDQQNIALRAEESHRLVVVELADGISRLAEGDLCVNAPIQDGATGIIADSINYIINQLRKLINEINQLTKKVNQVSYQATVRARALIKINYEHNRLVVHIQKCASTLLASAKEISERASNSNAVAKQAVILGKEGSEAVNETRSGMKRIHSDILMTENALHKLIERMNEIQSIVELISNIGSKTSMLALNAAIKSASSAGDNRAFGLVAEEIGILSGKCTQATNDIEAIVSAIQEDTMIVLTAMEETKETAVNGTKLAETAEFSLKSVVQTLGSLSDGVDIISQEVHQQRISTETIKKSLDILQTYSDRILSGTNENDASVKFIKNLSNSLQSQVKVFKLPREIGKAANG